MLLNRLAISGFKSFPDRSELAFDSGVTAIVGPNGCGKSNVVDAITWVLGEQSAKSLRGDQMQDVIFQGSDARKPTSAAEVRLRLSGVAAVGAKHQSRRRAAELKLEAAQQNLTRVDGIIFEVEKQRGALKRQAAKARRYKRLREELRRWEKVQFAQRYRTLGQAIEAARA